MPKDRYCPICNKKMQKRKQGLVCKNWKCKLNWKYYGWVYIEDEVIRYERRDEIQHLETVVKPR